MYKNNQTQKTIALIPACGGSKGIVGKNIRPLNGKTLICHIIEEVLKSSYLNEVFVSTEDQLIAKTSKECGAKIIYRPAELAKDESPTIRSIFVDEQVRKDLAVNRNRFVYEPAHKTNGRWLNEL